MFQDWHDLLDTICEKTKFNTVKEHIKNTKPFQTQTEALNYQKQFEYLYNLKRPHLTSLDNLDWLLVLEKKSILTIRQLLDIKDFCFDVSSVKRQLFPLKNDWSHLTTNALIKEETVQSLINKLVTADGSIKKEASQTLFQLTQDKNQIESSIKKVFDEITKNYKTQSLLQEKIVTNRYFRWVVPIKSAKQHDFKGVIHARSQTRQTVFMEPDSVIPLNNQMEQIQIDIEKEIQRLLKKISDDLSEFFSLFIETKKRLILIETLWTHFDWSKKHNCHSVSFSSHLNLPGLKHPLIDPQSVVSNTIDLDQEKNILLISGPNGGGKTVLLKSIGLACYMAQCGLQICTSASAQLPFFKKIHTVLGDLQDIHNELSSFTAQLEKLYEATQSDHTHLILIDEICSATEPEQGSALAQAFIDEYGENKSWVIATSHLEKLKTHWNKKIIHGSLEFNEDKTLTYKFFKGSPGRSLSFETAKRINIPEKIIKKASSYLSDSFKKDQKKWDEIHDLKKDLKQIKEDLETQTKEMKKKKKQYETLCEKVEENKTKQIQDFIKNEEKILKQMMNDQEHTKAKDHLKQMKETVKEKSHESYFKTLEEFKNNTKRGELIFIPYLNKSGVIQGDMNAKEEILILSDSLSLRIHWKYLKPPFKKAQRKKSSYKVEKSSDKNLKSDINLKGLTIDEAILKIEKFFDQSLTHNQTTVKIIHGRGVLKEALKKYLSSSLYVKKCYKNSSNDHSTLVELK